MTRTCERFTWLGHWRGAAMGAAVVGLAGCTYEVIGPVEDAEMRSSPIVTEHADGSVTLHCFQPEHLVAHLRNAMAAGQTDLIFEQLVSDMLKQNYQAKGLDPHESVNWLIANQRDVLVLLNRLSLGMNTPEVSWERHGDVYRARMIGQMAGSLRFRTLDLIRENGQYKLLMIS